MSRMPSARAVAALAAVLTSATMVAASPSASAQTSARSAAVAAAPVVTPAAAGIVGVPAPVRALDTRTTTPLDPGATRSVQVAGIGNVPANAKSVLVNLTVVRPAAGGYLAAFAAGSPAPATSNLNFLAGSIVPNAALVPVGTGGAISVRNISSGRTNVIVDLQGYVTDLSGTAPGTVTTVDPARLLDTRAGSAVPAHSSVTVQVAGRAGVPATGAGAVAVNLTVVSPAANGYLTAYGSGTPAPNTSVENFVSGQTRAGYAVVPTGNDGSITVYNGSGRSIQLLVDAFGYVAAGDATQTLAGLDVARPNRVYDGRSVRSCNGTCVTVADPISPNGSRGFSAATLGVPPDASAVLLAVTAVGASAGGSFSVAGTAGTTSVVNFEKSTATTNVTAVPLVNGVTIENLSTGTAFLILDVLGWVEPKASIGGSVRSSAGGPVPSARVLSGRPFSDGSGAPLLATADPDGAWSAFVSWAPTNVSVCATGPVTNGQASKVWTIGCHDDGGPSVVPVPVALGTRTTGVDVVLDPAGSLLFSVKDYAGAPVTSGIITAVNTTTRKQSQTSWTNSSGAASMDRLAAGDYVILLSGSSSSTSTPYGLASEWADDLVEPAGTAPATLLAEGAKTVHVTEGTTSLPVPLVADANGTIAGTLLDGHGSRVATSFVRALTASGGVVASVSPALDGSYRIRLHAGAYTICGYAYTGATPVCWEGNVGTSDATPVTVTAAQETSGIAITLP